MTSNDQRHIRERDENRFTFDMQEINNGVLNGSGTGSMSCDSSIGSSHLQYIGLHLFILYLMSFCLCVSHTLSSSGICILTIPKSNGIILYTTSK